MNFAYRFSYLPLFISLYLFCLSGPFSGLHAYTIRECSSIEEILVELKKGEPVRLPEDNSGGSQSSTRYYYPDTLLVFDIDNTIFRAAQTIGTDEWFRMSIHKALEENPHEPYLAKQRVIELWHAIQSITPIIPIEGEITSKTVQQSQKLAPTIAMTTRSHQISATTIHQLQSLGIDFSKNPLTYHGMWVPSAKEALYTKGILFTSAYSKGVALSQLIKASGYTPKRIIFINDKQSHIEDTISVEEELGIEFIGLRYALSDCYFDMYNHDDAEKEFQHFFSTLHQLPKNNKG